MTAYAQVSLTTVEGGTAVSRQWVVPLEDAERAVGGLGEPERTVLLNAEQTAVAVRMGDEAVTR